MDPLDLPARVLLVDDDEDDYLIVRNLLSRVDGKQFELQWVQSFSEAQSIIMEARHDAYLIDYRLGADNGLELLDKLDLQEWEQPFIILTGAGDQRIERKAMRLGV